MKKLLLAISILILFFSCSNNENEEIKHSNKFVYMKNNKFYIENNEFFPMVLNYKVSLIVKDSLVYPTPYTGYYPEIIEKGLNKDTCLTLLKSDMQMIKDMGFNTIRIVGIGEYLDTLQNKYIERYLDAVNEMYSITNANNIKVIFLLPIWSKKPDLIEKYKPLIQSQKDNYGILAYDFFNEPLYFDTVQGQRRKKDVYRITKNWKNYLQENSPNHLLTIGLAGPKETAVWDPNVLDVDFVSFHPYEYAENMVLRDLYWFNKYVEKPWIVGETSLSADNDSVLYSTQRKFADRVLQQAINCGAIGFSWWQYKDVEWGNHEFHQNYMGLLNDTGKTTTSNPDLIVFGTPKETIKVFQKFEYKKGTEIIKPDNYYNCYRHKNYKITGKLMREDNGKPAIGATIEGWYEDWSKSFITFVKDDGSFELWGEKPLYHFRISGTRCATFWKNIKNDGTVIQEKNPNIIDIGTQVIEEADL